MDSIQVNLHISLQCSNPSGFDRILNNHTSSGKSEVMVYLEIFNYLHFSLKIRLTKKFQALTLHLLVSQSKETSENNVEPIQ